MWPCKNSVHFCQSSWFDVFLNSRTLRWMVHGPVPGLHHQPFLQAESLLGKQALLLVRVSWHFQLIDNTYNILWHNVSSSLRASLHFSLVKVGDAIQHCWKQISRRSVTRSEAMRAVLRLSGGFRRDANETTRPTPPDILIVVLEQQHKSNLDHNSFGIWDSIYLFKRAEKTPEFGEWTLGDTPLLWG